MLRFIEIKQFIIENHVCGDFLSGQDLQCIKFSTNSISIRFVELLLSLSENIISLINIFLIIQNVNID